MEYVYPGNRKRLEINKIENRGNKVLQQMRLRFNSTKLKGLPQFKM